MKIKIHSKSNTDILQSKVDSQLFICAQGTDQACAIISSTDNITPAILEEMKELVEPVIVKIVGDEKDYLNVKSAFELVFDKVKFVQREGPFEVYFKPSPIIVRVSKIVDSIVSKVEFSESNPIKVLIVDDSSTICNLLKKIMSLSPLIKVVDAINDPLLAEDAIKKHSPDVITLDIHMPGINGVELLKKIQPLYGIPAIMISSISMQEGPLVLEALESGAVDYIQKPDMSNFANAAKEINSKIIISASSISKNQVDSVQSRQMVSQSSIDTSDTLIVIGASTGGTKALSYVFDNLPDSIPPILVVQHIPAEFSKAFADRLNSKVKFTIKEASDGDAVIPNQVLIAPGGKQMKFVNRSSGMFVEINEDEPVNRFKPSVDYLFDSVTDSRIDKSIVAAIFTGMGKDGSKAMKRLKDSKGAITISQDEQSSVVYGMPKAAFELGCVDHVVSLSDAAVTLMECCQGSQPLKKAQ